MTKRIRLGEEFWRRHNRLWKESGLTQKAYCLANQLNLKTFSRWRMHLKRAHAGDAKGTEALRAQRTFVPVHVVHPEVGGSDRLESSRHDIRIRLDESPWAIHIPPNADVSMLTELLAAVSRLSR